MALLGDRAARRRTGAEPPAREAPRAPSRLPGLALAAVGTALAFALHLVLPALPALTAALVLGVLAAHLPGARTLVNGLARPGLTLAGKRLMRLGIVLLGLKLSLSDVLGLGWATACMVVAVVAVTFFGTLWLGRLLRLPRDQPLLVATGYAICGASAIGAVSEVRRSRDPESARDTATSIALVTLCGTLAIAVLPLLQGPLGLDDAEFGRWVGAGVHDVGQVVATAQTAGSDALGQAVLVKLVRVLMLAPLVAAVAFGVRARVRAGHETPQGSGKRPPLVPLFVAGFAAAAAVRTVGLLSDGVLEAAGNVQEVLLAAALFGLGSAVHLPTLARTGARVAALGLGAWVVIGGVSYAGVVLTG